MSFHSREKRIIAARLLAQGMTQSSVARKLNLSVSTLHLWRRKDPEFNDAIHARARAIYQQCVDELEEMAFSKVEVNAPTKLKAIERLLAAANPKKWDRVVRAMRYAEDRDIKRRKLEEAQAMATEATYLPGTVRHLESFVQRWSTVIEGEGVEVAADADNADDE